VILLVEAVLLPAPVAHAGERVHDHEPGAGVLVEPLVDRVEAPFRGTGPLDGQVEVGGRLELLSLNELLESALKAPPAIFQGEIKHGPGLDGNAAKGNAALGGGEGGAEHEPALAYLRPAGEDRGALGDKAVNGPMDGAELLTHQGLGRDNVG